jgi:MGT family glycosyltransferase
MLSYSMARALFLSLPLHGHMNPALPLVAELVARGDEVICWSTDAFAAAVAGAGARFRPYHNAFLDDLRGLPAHTHALAYLLTRTSAEVLEAHLEAFRAEAVDYVIADSVAPWGQWVGEILGVPVVTSISTFAFNRHVLAFAATRGVRPTSARAFVSKLRHVGRAFLLGRRLRARYRVAGPGVIGSVVGHSGLNIVYTSRYFQPCASTFDDSYEFIGPSAAARADAAPFPWERLRHPVVVYVSLGTLFNADASFYRACCDGFGSEDVQVVMAIGEHVPVAALGAVPANVVVQPRVPQLEILERASAFVTHGGMNSVSESLHRGVPVLVVPQMGEQAIVGRRAEELGAGLCVERHEATATVLRDGVRQLLSGNFRHQARAVGDSFRAAGGVSRAAERIAVFTRGSATTLA